MSRLEKRHHEIQQELVVADVMFFRCSQNILNSQTIIFVTKTNNPFQFELKCYQCSLEI